MLYQHLAKGCVLVFDGFLKCVSVFLPVCMSPKEGVGDPGTGVGAVVSLCVIAGNHTWILCKSKLSSTVKNMSLFLTGQGGAFSYKAASLESSPGF